MVSRADFFSFTKVQQELMPGTFWYRGTAGTHQIFELIFPETLCLHVIHHHMVVQKYFGSVAYLFFFN